MDLEWILCGSWVDLEWILSGSWVDLEWILSGSCVDLGSILSGSSVQLRWWPTQPAEDPESDVAASGATAARVRKREPTQIKRAKPNRPRHRDAQFHVSSQPPQPNFAWVHEDFANKAWTTAYRASFPDEAQDEKVHGFYSCWLEKALQVMGRAENPKKKITRNFVSRTAYDATLLKGLLLTRPVAGHWWESGATALLECLKELPDPSVYGFTELSDADFQQLFGGDANLVLHDLLERHYGETIWLDKKIGPLAEKPRSIHMHHPQLFTQAHVDPGERTGFENAASFFELYKKTQAVENRFLKEMALVPNSVYKPRDSQECHSVDVRYHSLATLIYECCDVASLLDIYTFYCCQPLLTTRAPRSKSKTPPHKPYTGPCCPKLVHLQ